MSSMAPACDRRCWPGATPSRPHTERRGTGGWRRDTVRRASIGFRCGFGVATSGGIPYFAGFYPPLEDSMARVTVEDCVEKVPNRFSLVLLAAHRARAISAGSPLLVERHNDKNPVVSLREIADDMVDADGLRESLIASLQRVDERSEAEEEAETLA